MKAPAYLRNRRRDIHIESPWSQFGYHSAQLRAVVHALVAAASLEPGARVLDYGCADAPYRAELPDGAEYVGADLRGNPVAQVELQEDGTLPLPDRSFDLVLSTQVLEHVEEPGVYLDECRRVLRDGGALVLSTHGLMYYHPDPEDYWRWMVPALVKVLEERGFEVVEMRGVLGLAAAALQVFQDATMWKVPRLLKTTYAGVMQGFIRFLDRRYEEPLRLSNCLTIAVLARKRADRRSA